MLTQNHTSEGRWSQERWDANVAIPFAIVTLVGFIVVVTLQWNNRPFLAILWSLASLASGSFLGFIFGMPKVLHHDSLTRGPEDEARHGDRTTTNLADISDWLTKIIVVVALVQLKEIPGYLENVAAFMAQGSGGDPTYFIPLIVYFSLVGFIGFYWLTRSILGPSVDRQRARSLNIRQWLHNDPDEGTRIHEPDERVRIHELLESQSQVVRTVAQIDDRLARLQANPILDNFHGIISIRIRTGANKDLRIDDQDLPASADEERASIRVKGVRVAPRQHCKAIVQFENDNGEKSEGGLQERIKVTKGNVAETVTFDVGLDSRSLVFSPDRASSTFNVKSGSSPLTFGFYTSEEPGTHEIFVEVSQKNRLILVVPLSIIVVSDPR